MNNSGQVGNFHHTSVGCAAAIVTSPRKHVTTKCELPQNAESMSNGVLPSSEGIYKFTLGASD